jgi:predicted RecA/RadA family phage recombinase
MATTKKPVADGRIVTLTAPYQRNAGQAALIGAVVAVALQPVANAANADFALEGVWDLDKATGQTWTQGALIYWDNAAKNCTTTSTSNTRIGFAMQAQLTGDTVGRVRLNAIATPTGA